MNASLSAAALAAAILAFGSERADAAVVLLLERLSDTEARLTGSGTVDFRGFDLLLQGAASVGDTGSEPVTGDFRIGAIPVTLSAVLNGTTNFAFTGNQVFNPGDTVSGVAHFILDNETWAALGTTGDVCVDDCASVTGTFSIVPLPASGLLGLFGLGALGLIGRGRGAAARSAAGG